MLNESSPNNAHNEFLRTFFAKVKIKRKSFNSPWLKTNGSVKSSKKKQRLVEKFFKNRNSENELDYKQYKTIFQSLKIRSKKNYYSDLIDSYKYDIKNMGCYWRNY